ncbi:MAG: hypothetical protein K2G32_07810, partial [Oscillospiraceae bacterium]|nr:hypothetical protein [Oscillospiraceae bacterium]
MEDISPEVREFLSGLRARPGMYTGHDGMITELRLFLDGMKAIPLICSCGKINIIPHELHDFTARYYGESSSTMGWCNIILNHELDERTAFDKFWELLDGLLVSEGFEPIKKLERVPPEYKHSDGICNVLYCDLSALTRSFLRCNTEREYAEAVRRFADIYRTPGFYGTALWQDNFPVGAAFGNVEVGGAFRLAE